MALDPISAVFDGITTIVNKIWPDATQAQKDALALELAQLQAGTDLAKGQLAINQTEAANSNVFVAGWRPFIGWVCGAAFAYHFVLQPLLAFFLSATGHAVTLPAFHMEDLNTVLLGMLGLGGMRSYEKVRGIK